MSRASRMYALIIAVVFAAIVGLAVIVDNDIPREPPTSPIPSTILLPP